VRVPIDEAEAARARLLEIVPEGFEEVELPGAVELVAYGPVELERKIRGAFAAVSSVPVAPGWDLRWRAFHHPIRVGGLWIGPPWEEAPAGELAVVIDPGQAFGTGAHPTTRACIELLASERRASVLDAGCGSGVVAIAAARLGHAPVVAVDNDPVAVEIARLSASGNDVEVDVRQLDVLRDELPPAELLVANIELRTVESLLARCGARRAITSGYPVGERVHAPGWRTVRTLELEGWSAELLERI
jgi:ribosomal protein L11 methyltransferase